MRVLIADDDSDQRKLLGNLISSWGHVVQAASDGEEALAVIPTFAPNVIVTDLMMPQVDGLELMRRLRAEGSLPPTILLTAFGSLDLAVETVHKHGGFWFLEKPVDPGSLRALLQRASEQGRLASENERLRLELSQKGVLDDLVGQSPAMQSVFALIRHVAPTRAGVMITGESGVGKELAARAIHKFSPRNAEPFLAVNCAAIPENLIESELFGHEKGSFTGAFERHQGALELAQGGTLFLDEIGEMPLPMQAKLLRVLEDFRFRRLGGKQEMTADVRLVSATNRPPEQAIREGKLREDLYYRLNVFSINLPPLRERLEDIPLIAMAMIEKLNQKHGTRVTNLDPAAAAALASRRWNGNVRELRNTIERAIILANEGPLLPKHVALHAQAGPGSASLNQEGLDIRVGMTIEEAERVLLEATLKETGNNKTRAAETLGISAKTLHAKLKQYRMEDGGEELQALGERARA
ncbi:MAG: sigma-54 dependent transcriptional regulator [Acidobacteriota bacterium]